MKITEKQLHILQHSLGVDEYGRGNQYRNHFVTGLESVDWPICQELVAIGLMQDHGPQQLAGGDHFFTVTDLGKKAMFENSPAPPKLTRGQKRYREYLRVADCFESFGDWLRYRSKHPQC